MREGRVRGGDGIREEGMVLYLYELPSGDGRMVPVLECSTGSPPSYGFILRFSSAFWKTRTRTDLFSELFSDYQNILI